MSKIAVRPFCVWVRQSWVVLVDENHSAKQKKFCKANPGFQVLCHCMEICSSKNLFFSVSIFPICCINLTFQKPMQAANLTLERKFLFSVNTSESLWQLRMYFRPCWESPDQYYKKTFTFLSLWFDLPSPDWYFDMRWEPSQSTSNIFQRLGKLNFVFLKNLSNVWNIFLLPF